MIDINFRVKITIAACLCAFMLTAQKPGKSVVKWDISTEYNFGDIRREQPVSVVFAFSNTSKDSILLQTVRTTCGCTAASWTEAPIAPGAKGEVRVEYDAYQPGDFNKKIRVFFDKQRKPELLFISGTVK